MDRRQFLKNSFTTWGALTIPASAPGLRMQGAQGKVRPEYIRSEIPAFDIPPYAGKSYADQVPDTLDIAERARYAINALTSMPDPQADYEIYWAVDFFRNPPAMRHAWDDWIQYQEGFLEALPLLRTATGDNLAG